MKKHIIYVIFFLVLMIALCGCKKKGSQQEKSRKATELIIETNDKQKESIGSENQVQEDEDLYREIEEWMQLEQAKGTEVSVFVSELEADKQVNIGEKRMQAASLIKLYIAGCAYEQMELLKDQSSEAEIEMLIDAMVTVSDNNAANTLVTMLGKGDAAAGREMVNNYCASHGYASTHMGRLLLEACDLDDNYTSSADCGRFLASIYRGELPGSVSIITYLKCQERTGKIPAGIPQGIITANKTGELVDVENDAAIIYAEKGAYVLCVMMENLSNTVDGQRAIRELSTLVYQYMMNKV